MKSLLFLLLFLYSNQKSEYLVTRHKGDYEKYYRTYKSSNLDLLNNSFINQDSHCNNEINNKLKFKDNFEKYFSSDELAKIKDFRVSIKLFISTSGKVQQMEFTTIKNPSSILSIFAKIESLYKEKERINTTNCEIPENQFIRINALLK